MPFATLSPLLQASAPGALVAAQVSALDRDDLVAEFRSAFHAGKRVEALLYADGLIERGVPPVFWHDHRSRTDYSLEQRSDLFAYDVRWLRSVYPGHAHAIRYRRCKLMLTGSEKDFWREAEFAFFAGRRCGRTLPQ